MHVFAVQGKLRCLPQNYLKRKWDILCIAGIARVRQCPCTASDICFITIEDETGTRNVIVFSKVFKQYRKEILQFRTSPDIAILVCSSIRTGVSARHVKSGEEALPKVIISQ